jgi:hypothetical protein
MNIFSCKQELSEKTYYSLILYEKCSEYIEKLKFLNFSNFIKYE